MTTREKILYEALNFFSTKGFDPVSVRDIAGAVGIKESSLYNHFKNKQAIFDAILDAYSDRWGDIFNQVQLTGEDKQFAVDQRTLSMYQNMSREQFAMIAGVLYDYYMTDEINVKFRRMLTIEQYRSEQLTALFRRISFEESLDFQAQLFAGLMDAGCFVRTDPYMMAMAFFAPIFLIFYKYDQNPESIQAGRTLFLRHINHFNQTYGLDSAKPEANHESRNH
jgi:AcrR family transcriptional regulator